MTTPVKVREEKIDSTKSVKIHVRSWQPEPKPRAVIVICHGVNSHSGQYLWTGEQLAASGLAAYALDLAWPREIRRRAVQGVAPRLK